MDRRLTVLTAALSAATLLMGCASNGPATPAAPVATRSAPSLNGSAPGAPASRLKAESGYRKVSRNGEELYCKRELVTGSRTNSTETCLTAAQLEQARNNSDALLHSLQELNNGKPLNNGYNNVMGNRGRD